jgi:hypothetical protein
MHSKEVKKSTKRFKRYQINKEVMKPRMHKEALKSTTNKETLKIIKSTQQASNEQHQEFIARRC